MAQIRSSYNEIEIPFAKMSWNSDVPSSQLGPNEYNIGFNIETDVRGIKSVLGTQSILQKPTAIGGNQGTPVYITGGYRQDGKWYYIVGARYTNTVGRWFLIDETSITNITPGYASSATASVPGWTSIPNITEAWNGTALVINDGVNPPYFLQGNATEFEYYKQQASSDINGITQAAGTATISLATTPNVAYSVGDKITITDAFPPIWNGDYVVTGVPNNDEVDIADPGYTAWSNGGLLRPRYQWNYNPDWNNVVCDFLRVYNAPNIGSVLIAGNLTITEGTNIDATTNSTTTVTCSTASLSWVGYNVTGSGIPASTTIVSVIPNTSFVISNAATSSISNVLLKVQSPTNIKGPNTVRWSQNFGLNEVPRTWAPTVTNVANELEVPLRGPVLDGYPAGGNFYVASYWDTVVFSPLSFQTTQVPVFGVRLFNNGRGLLSSNCWANADDKVYGVDARDIWVFDGNNFTGLGNQRTKNYFYENVKPGSTYANLVFMENNTSKNQLELWFPYDDANTGSYCNEMISYRYDLDCWNPPYRITQGANDIANTTPIISGCEGPVFRANAGNIFDPTTRTITLIASVTSSDANLQPILQKDQGFAFESPGSVLYPIDSTFRRDNIQLLKDYSGQLLVHRILPEVNNINDFGRETTSSGNVVYNVGGNDSTGETPTMTGNISLAINTTDPWVQIDQNAFRLNSLEFSHSSNTNAIIMNSVTWQITQTQDAR